MAHDGALPPYSADARHEIRFTDAEESVPKAADFGTSYGEEIEKLFR